MHKLALKTSELPSRESTGSVVGLVVGPVNSNSLILFKHISEDCRTT